MKDKIVISVTILLLIFLTGIVSAVYSENLYNKQTKDTEQQKMSKQQTKKKQTKKPAQFIPSEKIDADSSVSFPVDI